jgi:hypothetical protein
VPKAKPAWRRSKKVSSGGEKSTAGLARLACDRGHAVASKMHRSMRHDENIPLWHCHGCHPRRPNGGSPFRLRRRATRRLSVRCERRLGVLPERICLMLSENLRVVPRRGELQQVSEREGSTGVFIWHWMPLKLLLDQAPFQELRPFLG